MTGINKLKVMFLRHSGNKTVYQHSSWTLMMRFAGILLAGNVPRSVPESADTLPVGVRLFCHLPPWFCGCLIIHCFLNLLFAS